MTITTIGTGLVGATAIVSAALAGTMIWLLLADPITVAGALHDGTVAPLFREFAQAAVGAIRALLNLL
jgi:hypothetical protein